jgi:hypothetical protein
LINNGKKQLILHIGDPKTETSSIQRAMQLNLVKISSKEEQQKISGFVNFANSANAINFARSFSKTSIDSRYIEEVEN